MLRLCVLSIVTACSGAPPEAAQAEGAEHATEAEETHMEPSGQDTSPLVVRLELERDTIPAGVSTSNNVEARITGRLFVRNTTTSPRELDFIAPATFELTWTFTHEDGTIYEPTFLPPPMPPPGGRPRSELTLAPGSESSFSNVGGISGFYKRGEAVDTFGPLPEGRYAVVVGGIAFEEGMSLTTAPVTLTAR